MHMSDALLSPEVGASLWAGAAGAIALSSRRLARQMDERMLPLMGVMGAFVFAAQMVNFAIPGTGSSGHLGGGLLLAVLLGPYAGFLAIAAVLMVQALFFADGGLLALGANVWNLGVYPCFIAYPLIYKPIAGSAPSGARRAFALIAAAIVGLQMGAFSVVMQTYLSGRSELPLGSFALVMQPVHLAIGLVEGIVTAGVIGFIIRERPEIVARMNGAAAAGAWSGRVIGAIAIATLLIGGAGAWVASERPDGLEWSIEKVAGSGEIGSHDSIAHRIASALQGALSFMPDYSLKGSTKQGRGFDAGASMAGILGSLILLVAAFCLGLALRRRKGKAGR